MLLVPTGGTHCHPPSFSHNLYWSPREGVNRKWGVEGDGRWQVDGRSRRGESTT